MEKKYVIFGFLLLSFNLVDAQMKVGANSAPAASNLLEVESTNRGFLPPRISLTSNTMSLNGIVPADGVVVFNTNASGSLGAGLCTWHDNRWNKLIDSRVSGTPTSFVALRKTSNQDFDAGDNRVNWDQISASQSVPGDSPMWGGANAIFIRRAGVYCITANLAVQKFSGTGPVAERYLFILKGDVQITASGYSVADDTNLNVSAMVYCAANEIIRIGYSSGGVSMRNLPDDNSFCVVAQIPSITFE